MTLEARSRSNFERRWYRRFQQYADIRDDDAGIAGWTHTGLKARIRRFKRIWKGDIAERLWVDAGCGAGSYVRLLSAEGLKVVGLDYCFTALRKARIRASGDAHWAAGDVTRLPLGSASVDGILCFGVTQTLTDSAQAVQELCRVVKPKGQVWVDALNGWCLPHLVERIVRKLLRRGPHLRYESPRRIRQFLQRNGIEEIQLFWLPILPGRLHRFQPLVEHPVTMALLQFLKPLGALLSHSFILYGQRRVNSISANPISKRT